MTATGTLVSLDEYLSTVYDPDCEYVDGELIERNIGASDHSALQGIIFASLFNQSQALGICVFSELRVQVAATRYRIPDITVIAASTVFTLASIRAPEPVHGSKSPGR